MDRINRGKRKGVCVSERERGREEGKKEMEEGEECIHDKAYISGAFRCKHRTTARENKLRHYASMSILFEVQLLSPSPAFFDDPFRMDCRG